LARLGRCETELGALLLKRALLLDFSDEQTECHGAIKPSPRTSGMNRRRVPAVADAAREYNAEPNN